MHAARVERLNRAPQFGQSNEVELVSLVETQIWVRGPEQYRVDAPVPSLAVVEVAIDRVVGARLVPPHAIIRVHLRLDVRRLRPSQLGHLVHLASLRRDPGRGARGSLPSTQTLEPLGVVLARRGRWKECVARALPRILRPEWQRRWIERRRGRRRRAGKEAIRPWIAKRTDALVERQHEAIRSIEAGAVGGREEAAVEIVAVAHVEDVVPPPLPVSREEDRR